MANKRISELTELASADIASNDLFIVTDVSVLESKKLQATGLKNFVLDNGRITGSITYALSAGTASYIDSASFGPVISSSYAISASWSNRSGISTTALTASYIDGNNVSGSIPSSSYSQTASYVNYRYNNGRVENSQTASYCELSVSSSFLKFTPGINNGTCSYALTSAYMSTSGTASYLSYTGIPNGTASFALRLGTDEVTSSYLMLKAGRQNGTASWAVSSSWASRSFWSSQSSFLIYNGSNNGTASYSMNSLYANTATTSGYALVSVSSSWAATSVSSSYASTASYCLGTASFVLSSSYTRGTSSFALVSDFVNDSNLYRIYGPYNSTGADGVTGTEESYVQNFIISPTTGVPVSVIVQATCDIKVPITTSEATMSVNLYLDTTEPGNEFAYGPLDTSRPANYISAATTGALSISGYSRHAASLGGNWNLTSGSWYRLSVRTAGGALIDTTRGVTFMLYTKTNTSVTKTAYPPF
jgi:hypothetical protein